MTNDERVFIAGGKLPETRSRGDAVARSYAGKRQADIASPDAFHTHSPKAGQGMNVSMGDTYSLGWKIAHVLQGKADPSILKTYQSERHQTAQELIDLDYKLSRMFSATPSTDASDKVGFSLPSHAADADGLLLRAQNGVSLAEFKEVCRSCIFGSLFSFLHLPARSSSSRSAVGRRELQCTTNPLSWSRLKVVPSHQDFLTAW